MKGFLKFLTLFFLSLASIKMIKTKTCPNKADECEYCDMAANNMVTLTCNTVNKSINYDQIFDNIQSLYYSSYSSISIRSKIFQILPSYVFKGKDIVTLILSNNQIEYILNDTFSGMKSLENLDLSNNMLKSIDDLIISFSSGYTTNRPQALGLVAILNSSAHSI